MADYTHKGGSGDIILPVYRTWAPSRYDSEGLSLPDRQDWLVCPAGHNRDSDTLTESNWAVQLRELERVDHTGEDFESHRFSHWGPGWFEIVLVKPGTPAATLANEFACALSDYPVLDDAHFSEAELEAHYSVWQGMRLADRVAMLSKQGLNIMAARRDELPAGIDTEGWEV